MSKKRLTTREFRSQFVTAVNRTNPDAETVRVYITGSLAGFVFVTGVRIDSDGGIVIDAETLDKLFLDGEQAVAPAAVIEVERPERYILDLTDIDSEKRCSKCVLCTKETGAKLTAENVGLGENHHCLSCCPLGIGHRKQAGLLGKIGGTWDLAKTFSECPYCDATFNADDAGRAEHQRHVRVEHNGGRVNE